MTTTGPLSVMKDGDVTIVIFGAGQRHLDEVGLEAISSQLIEIADEAKPPCVVLDMTMTEFFGSSFIEILFRVWQRLKKQPNSRFAISGLQEYCREVLEITHLDKLWPLYATRAEAVAGMAV